MTDMLTQEFLEFHGVTDDKVRETLQVLLVLYEDSGSTGHERVAIADVRTILWDILDGQR